MKENLKTYSIFAIGTLSGAILLFAAVKYIFPVIAPFLIAWLMALATRSPARSLSKKIHVPERVLRLMMSIFLTLFVFCVAALIVWQGAGALWKFLNSAGESGTLEKFFDILSSPTIPFLGEIIPDELAVKIGDALTNALSSLLSALASAVTSLAGALPGALLFLLVTVISLVYFALDLERINGFVKAVLPTKARELLTRSQRGLFDVGRRYLRSYLILAVITYGILLVGFFILRVEGAAITSLFVSLLDILPVIGVGTVLIPWGIIEIALGNHFLGIGLLVLFVVNATVRQFAEPKIVGKSLNMHPVLTLMIIYVGYALFGVKGLLILPLIAIAVSALLQKDHSSEVA